MGAILPPPITRNFFRKQTKFSKVELHATKKPTLHLLRIGSCREDELAGFTGSRSHLIPCLECQASKMFSGRTLTFYLYTFWLLNVLEGTPASLHSSTGQGARPAVQDKPRSSRLFGDSFIFRPPFPGTKTSPSCRPQWSAAVHINPARGGGGEGLMKGEDLMSSAERKSPKESNSLSPTTQSQKNVCK